jgi:hypothetical protein
MLRLTSPGVQGVLFNQSASHFAGLAGKPPNGNTTIDAISQHGSSGNPESPETLGQLDLPLEEGSQQGSSSRIGISQDGER